MDAYSFGYIECDVPEGMTLAEWRRRRCGHHAVRRSPALLARLRRIVGRG